MVPSIKQGCQGTEIIFLLYRESCLDLVWKVRGEQFHLSKVPIDEKKENSFATLKHCLLTAFDILQWSRLRPILSLSFSSASMISNLISSSCEIFNNNSMFSYWSKWQAHITGVISSLSRLSLSAPASNNF